MKRIVVGVVATLFCIALVGCSGFDSTQILDHPDSVTVSSSFDVALVNVYMYVDTGKTISHKVERDSLHLLVGLPASWNVLGARMVKASNMGTGQMLALQSGTMDQLAIAGLIKQFQAQAVDMVADNTLPAALKGKTVSAHSADAATSVDVVIDNVKQWKGFSAPVNIVLNQGDKPDTIVPLDSAISFAVTSGMMPDSTAKKVAALKSNPLVKLPDTVGISVVPVAVFLKIQASAVPGNDTLYYFSKTDSMNPKPSSIVTTVATLGGMPMLTQIEAGDMAFAAITVKSAAAVSHSAVKFSASGVRVIADMASGSVRINLGSYKPGLTSVGIYSLRGALVATLTPTTNQVVWNGRDSRGLSVSAGTYFIRIGDAAGNVVQSVQLLR